MKVTKNTKGYVWEVRVNRQPSETDEELFQRLKANELLLSTEFGSRQE